MIRDTLTDLCNVEAELAEITARRDALRSALLTAALDELEETGAAPTWRTDKATVGLTMPKATPAVVDEEDFADFVADRYGEELVETVRRVNPTRAKEIFASCSEALSNCALVTTDGELLPGVVLKTRVPYLSVRLTDKSKLAALVTKADERV